MDRRVVDWLYAMAHDHDHKSTYFLEQLWTIVTCGALGIVMVLLWHYQVLPIILDRKFHEAVLWGGIVLLILVGIRIVDLWFSAARLRAATTGPESSGEDHGHMEHDHAHEHVHAHEAAAGHVHNEGEECCHDHHTGHDCGHDHGWAPWRYAVLLLPTVLFLMKLPWPEPPDVPERSDIMVARLAELEQSSESAAGRDAYRDKTVRVKGKIQDLWNNQRVFGFVRLKMTCCYADAYGEPVKIMIESPKPIDYDKVVAKGGWVKVIGKLDYRKAPRADSYIPVIKAENVAQISVPSNQFEN
jgi:hypothetical protein